MASSASINEQLHQPVAQKRNLEKKQDIKRSFQRSWYEKWLYCLEDKGAAFCFLCAKVDKASKLRSGTQDQAFVKRGFTD